MLNYAYLEPDFIKNTILLFFEIKKKQDVHYFQQTCNIGIKFFLLLLVLFLLEKVSQNTDEVIIWHTSNKKMVGTIMHIFWEK